MLTKFAITSALELAAALLFLYGVWHKDKLIAWERRTANRISARWQKHQEEYVPVAIVHPDGTEEELTCPN